jgi:hypothetical protein
MQEETRQDKTKQEKTRQDLDKDKDKTAKPEDRVLSVGTKECCPYEQTSAALWNERVLP